MDAVQKRSRRFRRRVEAFLYLGIFLAMAGGFGLLYIHNTVDSLEQEYKQERASQIRSQVWLSHDHHPHNQKPPWVVTSGRDNRDVYDEKIELYEFFQPHARLSLIAGLSVTLLAGIVLIVDLALRTIKPRGGA